MSNVLSTVASVYGAKATRSTFNKVHHVEFNFVASAYRALEMTVGLDLVFVCFYASISLN